MSLQFHTHLGFPALKIINPGRGPDDSLQVEKTEGHAGDRAPGSRLSRRCLRGQILKSFRDYFWIHSIHIGCLSALETEGLGPRRKPAWQGPSGAGAGGAPVPCVQSVRDLVPQGSASPGTPGRTGQRIPRSSDFKGTSWLEPGRLS